MWKCNGLLTKCLLLAQYPPRFPAEELLISDKRFTSVAPCCKRTCRKKLLYYIVSELQGECWRRMISKCRRKAAQFQKFSSKGQSSCLCCTLFTGKNTGGFSMNLFTSYRPKRKWPFEAIERILQSQLLYLCFTGRSASVCG